MHRPQSTDGCYTVFSFSGSLHSHVFPFRPFPLLRVVIELLCASYRMARGREIRRRLSLLDSFSTWCSPGRTVHRRHQRSGSKRYHERLHAGADCRLRWCLPPPRHPSSVASTNVQRCWHASHGRLRLLARFFSQSEVCHAVRAWLTVPDKIDPAQIL